MVGGSSFLGAIMAITELAQGFDRESVEVRGERRRSVCGWNETNNTPLFAPSASFVRGAADGASMATKEGEVRLYE
jgi:hypothetical protein